MLLRYLVFLTVLFFQAISFSFAMGDHPPKRSSSVSDAQVPAGPVSFTPLTLREAYQFALQQSEVIAIRKVEVSETWADFLEASGELIGDGSYVVTAFYQQKGASSSGGETGATSTATRHETRESRFEFSQPLFQGFKSLGALTASKSLRTERVNQRRWAELLLFYDVAEAFYNVLGYKHDVEITQAMIGHLNDRIKELKEWEEIGRSRSSESVTAEARQNSLEADLADLEGIRLIELRVLEFLTGLSLETYELRDAYSNDSSIEFAATPIEGFIEAVATRPDVLAAQAEMKTAFRTIISAQSDLWPNLSLDSNVYDRREGFRGNIDWDVLLTLDIPLYRGGETFGLIKRAQSNFKKSKLSFREVSRRSEMEVSQSYDRWISALARYRALKKAVATSRLNFKLQKEDYARNLVNNLDVLEALNNLNETEIEANHAFYNVKKAYWQLRVESGACCEFI